MRESEAFRASGSPARQLKYESAGVHGRESRRDRGADAAAGREGGHQRHAPRLDHGHQVVENAVGHVLVKNALVAELLQIELQAFQLDALAAGTIGERQRAEIGLARLGADRRELGADDLDRIVAVGKLIVKGFQSLAESLSRSKAPFHKHFIVP